ncbi:uncharacterized protein LOC127860038 [Dreissena polymorpha]|uniref:uncharacterized protein LOC127860038 n=1 Tax=Dreissena polymorpha TaxID=45954 RepID=UPI0022656824|nr:uncharacterized protein LOC127860038 [Dreissena polymorpha]
MLHFLLDVLEILSGISRKFQSQTACVSEVLSEIDMAVVGLEKMKNRNGMKLRQAMETAPAQLTGDDRSFISARQKFLTAIVESLHQRFTDKPGILAAVSAFNLSLFPSEAKDLQDYGDDEVDQLVDHFGTALEDAGVEINQVAHERTKLKQLMPTRFSGPVSSFTWADVNSKLGKVCPNILALVDLVYTIPASSADAERGFCYLKNTKSASRNTLLDTNLSNQMMVVLETEAVQDYDPTEAVHLWNAAAMRRLRQEPSCNRGSTTRQLGENTEQKARTVPSTAPKESELQMIESSDSHTEEETSLVRRDEEHVTQSQVSTKYELTIGEQELSKSEEIVSHEKNCVSLQTTEQVDQDQVLKKISGHEGSKSSDSDAQNSQVKCSESDQNNNVPDFNNKQDKIVGSNCAIPIFLCKTTQTETISEQLLELDEEAYTSDSDVYEHEYYNCEKDCSEFENHVEYADRLKLAKNAYEEFLTILNCE